MNKALVHARQIKCCVRAGFDEEWMYILDFYIRPLQERVFIGYFHNPPRSLMNFIVR
jgi:procollagen-lysine,2-oxoglutarate 5-dioxygenase